MKKTAFYIGFFLLLVPQISLAQVIPCSAEGYTVVFINGVLGNYKKALDESDALAQKLGSKYQNESLVVRLGYNPPHLVGAGDFLQSLAQQFSYSVSNFDLNTILMQIHPEVTTRKMLIVGHSQGAYYSNEMYSYLAAHGEPTKAIDVYNIGTPSPVTVGSGKYLNSSDDTILNYLRDALGFKILPSNIDIISSVDDALKTWPGHSFTGAYLASAPERIVSDISGLLVALEGSDSTDSGGCFTPPNENFGYKTQKIIFAVADPSAVAIKNGTIAGVQGTIALINTVGGAVHTAINFFMGGSTAPAAEVDETSNAQKDFTIFKKLYGSSLDTSEVKKLLDNSQGAGVVLAVVPEKPLLINGGLVSGTSTTNLNPKVTPPAPALPVIPKLITQGGSSGATSPTVNLPPTPPSSSQEVAPPVFFDASSTLPVLNISACAYSLSNDFCFLPTRNVTLAWTAPAGSVTYGVKVNDIQVATTSDTSLIISLPDQTNSSIEILAYDSADASLASNKKSVFIFEHPMVINEIQWGGDAVDPGREWFELKNRTAHSIDTSRLVLYAKEGGEQYIPLGRIVSHFLTVERDPTAPFTHLSEELLVVLFEEFNDSGEQLAIAWSDGVSTTTLDQTPSVSACNGWCAGASRDSSGINVSLSMERIDPTVAGDSASNWAHNDMYDVSANMPGGQGQVLYATPGRENSLHLPEAAFMCEPDIFSITAGQSYHPSTDACKYLGRFVLWPNPISGALFKGVVGNATLLNLFGSGYPGGASTGLTYGNNFSDAQPGDNYFVAIWGSRTNIPSTNDDGSLVSYLTTGHRIDGDTQNGFAVAEDTNPPSGFEYRIIPFVYGP